MRLFLLAAALLASSSVLAQEASDLATLISHSDAQLLSTEDAANMGIETNGPVWLVPIESPDTAPSLGYELPASVLPSEKDPGLAIIIGILLPGGAQIYAGDNDKGLMLLGVAYGSLIGGWFLAHALDIPILALVGSAGYLAATVYGVLEATDDVEAANRRNGYALVPSVTRTDDGYAGGLSLRASF